MRKGKTLPVQVKLQPPRRFSLAENPPAPQGVPCILRGRKPKRRRSAFLQKSRPAGADWGRRRDLVRFPGTRYEAHMLCYRRSGLKKLMNVDARLPPLTLVEFRSRFACVFASVPPCGVACKLQIALNWRCRCMMSVLCGVDVSVPDGVSRFVQRTPGDTVTSDRSRSSSILNTN